MCRSGVQKPCAHRHCAEIVTCLYEDYCPDHDPLAAWYDEMLDEAPAPKENA